MAGTTALTTTAGRRLVSRAAWTPNAKFGLIENYLVGPEGADNGNIRHLTDTVMTYNPNSKLSLMANYDYGHDRLPGVLPGLPSSAVWWSGIAGYIKYAPNDKWDFATRGEWFKDHDGFSTGTPQTLGEFTLTLQRMLAGKIMSRLEYRYDISGQEHFPVSHRGIPGRSANTVTVGLVYAFSSADAK